ncbi:MAG TPA: hypothetical protein VFD60_03040 [Nitrososphaeraceae archaeon]|nr:hypothetical protein [Nitrososphaeraceae archaeon]
MLDSIRISRSHTTSNATLTSNNAVVDKIVGYACKTVKKDHLWLEP